MQSKMFLGIVTVFAIATLAFPCYSSIFYSRTEKQIVVVDQCNFQKVVFEVNGMTCTSCEENVSQEVNKLTGIVNSQASYAKGNTVVAFDNAKINISEIVKSINSTGYSVTSKIEN